MLERLILICLLVIAAPLVPWTEADAAKCARGATYRCVSSGGTRLCACWKTGSEICDVDFSTINDVGNCIPGVNCPVLTCSVYGTIDTGDNRCDPTILDPDCGIEGLVFTMDLTTNLFATTVNQARAASNQGTRASSQGISVSSQGNRRSSLGRSVSSQGKSRSTGKQNSSQGRRSSRHKPKYYPHPTPPPPTPPPPTPPPPTPPPPTPPPTPAPPTGEPVVLKTILTRSTEIDQCAATRVCEETIELDPLDCPDCEDPDLQFITFTASEFNSEVCVCPGGFSTTGECCATPGRESGGDCAQPGKELCIIQLCTTDLTDYEPGMNLPYSCKVLQEPPCVEKYFVGPGEVRCRR